MSEFQSRQKLLIETLVAAGGAVVSDDLLVLMSCTKNRPTKDPYAALRMAVMRARRERASKSEVITRFRNLGYALHKQYE
jgi:DNA-binding response OmpR family regulator